MSGRVEPEAGAELQNNFATSLKPLSFWLRAIGIELEYEKATESWKRIATITLAGMWLLFNFCVQGISCAYLKFEMNQEANDTTSSLNLAIESTNFAVNSIGIHMAIFFLLATKWRDLRAHLHNMEEHMSIQQENYLQLRRLSLTGVFYVIFTKGFMILLHLYNDLSEDNPDMIRLTINVTMVVSQIFPASMVVLIGVISVLFAKNFQFIGEEMKRMSGEQSVDPGVAILQLRKLRYCHSLICSSCEKFKTSFSLIIFLKIVYIFVAVINSSFYLLTDIVEMHNKTNIALHVALIVEHFLQLWIVSHTTDTTYKKALDLVIILRNMQLTEGKLEQQAYYFAQQVHHSLPEVTAMDFFQVSKTLFPQLIGSTLTYLIILYQFRVSQKSN